MNVATQIMGERIASEVASRTLALERLQERQHPLNQWKYLANLAAGGCWGLFMAFYTGAHAQLLLGLASGAAVAIACAAFQECIQLRRRLEAVIVLSKTGGI